MRVRFPLMSLFLILGSRGVLLTWDSEIPPYRGNSYELPPFGEIREMCSLQFRTNSRRIPWIKEFVPKILIFWGNLPRNLPEPEGNFWNFPRAAENFQKFSRGRVAPEGNFWKFSDARGKFQKLTKGEGKFRQIPEKNRNFCQIQNYKLSFVTGVDKLCNISAVFSD